MRLGQPATARGIGRKAAPRLWAVTDDLAVECAGDPRLPRALERPRAGSDRAAAGDGREGARFAIEVDALVVGRRRGPAGIDETHRTAMLGIAIGAPNSWGRGFGREAVRRLLDDAFRPRTPHRARLWLHADGARAIAASRASGVVEEGRLRGRVRSNGRDVDAVRMGDLRAEWRMQ